MIRNIFLLSMLLILTGCFNKNKLEVTFSNDIKEQNILIELKAPADLADNVIFKGGTTYKIPDVYGENDWKIIYKDSLSATFRHFKTNRNDKHQYNFRFYKEGDAVMVDVKIEGISKFVKTVRLE